MKLLAKIIWEIAEILNINLGKFAPYIFGAMIGRWPHKQEKNSHD